MSKLTIGLIMIAGVLTASLADINGPIYFKFIVDTKAPQYDVFGANASVIRNINESIEFFANWSDPHLDYWIFEWDITGVEDNVTTQSFTTSWSNYSKAIDNSSWERYNISNFEGAIVWYWFYARDTYKNWNKTETGQFVIVTKHPEPLIYEQDNGSPINGSPVLLSTYWSDNFEVRYVELWTSESGDLSVNGSPIWINSTIGWANFTYDTAGFAGETIEWLSKGFDAAGNSNTSPVMSFNVQ